MFLIEVLSLPRRAGAQCEQLLSPNPLSVSIFDHK